MNERVLMIVAEPFVPWQGASLRARHTASALAGLGYPVDLLVLPGGDLPELPGVRIVRAPRIPLVGTARANGVSARGIYRWLLLLRAATLALGTRYRFVHGVDGAWLAAWAAARLCGAELIYECSEAADDQRGAYGEGFALRRAAAVITADPAVVAHMRRLGHESRACLISDIPGTWQEGGDRDAQRAETRARLELAAESTVVTYVGSFRKFQGVDLIFNALPALLREAPGTRLLMVGGVPRDIAQAQTLLQQAGVAGAVTFLGQVPTAELVGVLAASDILVAPRRSGTHAPMKVLDYLLAGRAVVATDSAANRSVLTPACAVLAPPSPEAFARAIAALARRPDRRTALGEAGRARVLADFSFDAFQDGLRRCYAYAELKQ